MYFGLIHLNLSKNLGFVRQLAYNGPAIWGGCVPAIGGVAHFLLSRPALTEPQASASWVQILLSITLVAPKALTERSERHGVQV